ncbi:hypothetical protein SCHIN_v1c07130 [Spiroplasma chinense]|uniref:Lipoprotein n=1 Tax=Spiroplasma chinense TaxID=216932 RepID=A0A5B9Y419_9MOLU|nr:lipoprotein [Spiroplasma chinense]QEH61908.1 hypothetical protein SCHIN_v1c07130 [Spiroplasma chinense]
MKKLLGILGAMGLVASTGSVVVACGGDKDTTKATKISINAAGDAQESEVTISAFVEGKTTGEASSSSTTSILNVTSPTFSKDVLKGNVKFELKDKDAVRAAEVKETITFKYNDAVVATFEVTVAKSATTPAPEAKKDLATITGDDLVLAAGDMDEAAAKAAAIAKINAKLEITVVETTDVTFDGFVKAEAAVDASEGVEAKPEVKGTIVVKAVEASTLVSGTVTFTWSIA